jgi:hypothetical protein
MRLLRVLEEAIAAIVRYCIHLRDREHLGNLNPAVVYVSGQRPEASVPAPAILSQSI